MQNWSHEADDAPPPAAPGPALDRPPPPQAPPPRLSQDAWRQVPTQQAQQRPLAWQAAPPEPGPGALTRIGIAATSLLVAGAFVVVGMYLAERRTSTTVDSPPPVAAPTPTPSRVVTPSPTSPSPTPSLAPSPTSTPSVTVSADPGGRSWTLPERAWEPLPAADPESPLYALQATPLDDLPPVTLTGCPEPGRTGSQDEWKEAVRGQWSCVHAAWMPVFEQLGWSVVEPEVQFYPGAGSKSECGYLSAPAFYCSSGDGTVYFGQEHFEMAATWDLSVNEMVNHEYGHHIQKLAGITAAKLAMPPRNELERRSELQATCWSAMMTYHNRSFGFNADDLASWNERLDTMLIDSVHGTRESLTYWGTRGLYAATVADCNTWVVDADQVT